MKIDLKKAYDMVSWEFLEEVLIHFGFSGQFVKWIMLEVTTTMFSVKVNGGSHGFFAGNVDSVNRVMETLAHFSAATDLEVNLEKSNVYLAGVDESVRTQILAKTRFSEGRLQVINAVFFSIHSFWGALFILPQSILKKVDQICRDFLWGNSANKKKVALVSWDKMRIPKRQNGLNIKSCSNWNKAYVGQLLWQIIVNKESLWVKWVHDIYMKNDISIWTHKTPIDCKWYWRKINAFKEHMHGWYNHRRYMLTQTGKYYITKSYQALMDPKPR
ncbi:hypothetical protein MTR67_028642 [Solanum verrucosum]|uniref:Uncharacterized protein n=1 Tax=Solanum verrucosum TaxID=315347 RepID=A0AAF0TW06_SOLVR|nr:hypothetical protein MTR67_028642 [Solanum verrucosum]